MATRLPVICPICDDRIDPETDLERHLLTEHRPPELARHIVTSWEDDEFGERP